MFLVGCESGRAGDPAGDDWAHRALTRARQCVRARWARGGGLGVQAETDSQSQETSNTFNVYVRQQNK